MSYQIADIFEAIADAVPDRIAIVCGDDRLTYAQLDERATRMAHALESRGIKRGDHIGTYMHNSAAYVTTMIAAFKIGAVPININYRYVEEELKYLFHNADLKALVHDRQFSDRIAAVSGQCPDLRVFVSVEDRSGADLSAIGSLDFEDVVSQSPMQRDFSGRSGDDIFIIYTGGTTGMPKGVMWRHEDIFFAGFGGGNPTGEPFESIEAMVEHVAAGTMQLGMLVAAPLIHGAAQLGTFIGLFAGNKVIYQPRFDPDDVVRLIDAEKVNTISLVGDAMARPISDALDANAASGAKDVSSLFIIASAGAIFSQPVKERLKKVLPNCGLIDSYGSTETGFQGTGAGGESRSFGQGLSFAMNDRTVVIDDDKKRIEPGSGERGRVALTGYVPMGYYNDPKKTAETFVVLDGLRYSITGDIAEVEADGTIKLFGRESACINSGGEKIFTEEVENALKSFEPVYDAVVVGVDDDQWGQRVTALISLEANATAPSEADIQEHARSKVAGYKVPKEVFFVDEVFRGPNGKADYKMAKQIATDLSNARA